MQNAHAYRILNDLVLLSASMQEKNPHDLVKLAEARRIGYDARALLRLLLEESSPQRRALHII